MHDMMEERMKAEGKGCDMEEDEHECMVHGKDDMKKFMKNMMKQLKSKKKQIEWMMKELMKGKDMMKSKIDINMFI